MTANGKTAFILTVISIFLPALASIILAVFFDLEIGIDYFHFIGNTVIIPGIVCLILFIIGVKQGEKRIFRKGGQLLYWAAIPLLFLLSLSFIFIYLHKSRIIGYYKTYIFMSPIAAFGYYEGCICAIRKKAKWLSILPTAVISLFITLFLFICIIFDL